MDEKTLRRIAITRGVGPGLVRCELTHLPRGPIDVELARAQHRRYESCLERLGCDLRRLPAEPDLPDAVFVEDAAVVLDELAIITRPGAPSRRPEVPSVADALRPYRPLRAIEPPGTIDGGDVLVVGRTLFVGLSSRTNREGLDQLRGIVEPLGYRATHVEVGGCLHLKSAVTRVGRGLVLANRSWFDADAFAGVEIIDVSPDEPFGANALVIGNTVVHAAAFPATRERLDRRGISTCAVDVSELAKAEGAVTCCSLVLDAKDE